MSKSRPVCPSLLSLLKLALISFLISFGSLSWSDMIRHVPIRLMQEQVVHVPKVIQQERISHQHVEQVVEVHVPMTQEHHVGPKQNQKRGLKYLNPSRKKGQLLGRFHVGSLNFTLQYFFMLFQLIRLSLFHIR